MQSMRWIPGAAGAAALCAAAIVAFARPSGAAPTPSGTITVTGQSTLSVAPNQAQIDVGTQLEAKTAASAMQEDSSRINAIVSALEKAGVASKDIQTSGYNLNPNENQPSSNAAPRITGYSISDTLTVTTTNLASVGTLIDDAVQAGANQVNGVNFTVANQTSLQNRANGSALAQAKSQAAYLAAQAGEHLGPLVSISVNQPSGPIFAASNAFAATATAPNIVPPSSLQVSGQVTAVYRLVP